MKEIKLTQGKVTLVDDDWFEYLNQWKWTTQKDGTRFYARRHPGIKMHRVIMNCPEGMEVDHIDMDGLNNQMENLRICTRAENQRNRGKNSRNTSGYKGVSWHKGHKKFSANIRIERKLLFLGYFTSPEDAARAYDKKAKELFGEYAKLNFENSVYVNKMNSINPLGE